MSDTISVAYGGVCLRTECRFRQTADFLRNYQDRIRDGNSPQLPDPDCDVRLTMAQDTVKIREIDLPVIREYYRTESWNAAIEQAMLGILTSEALMPYDRIFFHSAAFLWRGGAWLLAAPSGTGKTTQLRHWLNLYGDEIEVINGDKPLLYIPEQGTPRVFPSPWNGKENYGGTASAPLAGVICLEQGPVNVFEPMENDRAVDSLFWQFLTFMRTTEQVHIVCRFEERLLRAVPVWRLRGTGGPEAARLTHDRLFEYVSSDVKEK